MQAIERLYYAVLQQRIPSSQVAYQNLHRAFAWNTSEDPGNFVTQGHVSLRVAKRVAQGPRDSGAIRTRVSRDAARRRRSASIGYFRDKLDVAGGARRSRGCGRDLAIGVFQKIFEQRNRFGGRQPDGQTRRGLTGLAGPVTFDVQQISNEFKGGPEIAAP